MTKDDPAQLLQTTHSERLDVLLEQYGELMTGRDLVRLFRYESVRAFRRAAIAGRLPVPVKRIEGRPGWFASTRDVARWLDAFEGREAAAAS